MTIGAIPQEGPVRCPRCRKPLDPESVVTSPQVICPYCSGDFEAVRFYPPEVRVRVHDVAAAGLEEGQPCALHPRNAAVASCERCGAFMCALCRIDVDNRVLCPGCFERLSAEGALAGTQTRFRDYGGLSSLTATAGCLIWFFAVVFGPLSIYYGVKALRQKAKMNEPEGRVGVWLAMLLGAVETVVSIFFIGALIIGAVS